MSNPLNPLNDWFSFTPMKPFDLSVVTSASGIYHFPSEIGQYDDAEIDDDENLDDDTLRFFEGCMWEDYPWEIQFDVACDNSNPCRHCQNVQYKARGDGQQYAVSWICPRVVIATNEGGYNSTGVCLDCILEAAKDLGA